MQIVKALVVLLACLVLAAPAAAQVELTGETYLYPGQPVFYYDFKVAASGVSAGVKRCYVVFDQYNYYGNVRSHSVTHGYSDGLTIHLIGRASPDYPEPAMWDKEAFKANYSVKIMDLQSEEDAELSGGADSTVIEQRGVVLSGEGGSVALTGMNHVSMPAGSMEAFSDFQSFTPVEAVIVPVVKGQNNAPSSQDPPGPAHPVNLYPRTNYGEWINGEFWWFGLAPNRFVDFYVDFHLINSVSSSGIGLSHSISQTTWLYGRTTPDGYLYMPSVVSWKVSPNSIWWTSGYQAEPYLKVYYR